ncbi:YhdP family protein [Extensimonas sp. H3M7-6]|uniref:YhdP family protein n=1 Tax=Extensimonas soli TaxID=3031322 RepID=UPI0023DA85E4|nr:YhdP family protein [Extensimonas sp. H3M7-6]MDF1481732.1 YhdP family protein [Extensimonas sp. H3M7-6]
MTAAAARPTRLIRIVAASARWTLGLLLAFWLLLAIVWAGLHGWIVPRIGDFRASLEAQATRIVGVPVRIGAITGRSTGLIPSFELSEVALLDAQGRPALQLPRVVLALSPRALLTRGFEQLYLERPQLDLRRTADGRILIGGIALAQGGGDSPFADWFFAQAEVLIRGGTVRWFDEQHAAPAPLELRQVDVLLRNHGWQHNLRVDATPPSAWGSRFTLMARMRAPLLHPRDGQWQHWSGQLFADFAHVDLAQLRAQVLSDAPVEVAKGAGSMRVWADIDRAILVGGVADLALTEVHTTLAPELQPLAFVSLGGRIGGQRLAGGYTLFTEGLRFRTGDGLAWPGGNLRLQRTAATDRVPEYTQLQAERLDLAALAQIGMRLPLDAGARAALQSYQPQGLVESLQASWRGPLAAPTQYQLRGKVQGLAFAAGGDQGSAAPGAQAGVPGVRGAAVELDLNQDGGKAALAIRGGALVLPGVFEEPQVPLDYLDAEVQWQVQPVPAKGQKPAAAQAPRIAVQARKLRFANADLQGEAQASWHTREAAPGLAAQAGEGRFPGVLDLTGSLARADGARVWRYLPLGLPEETRHYVRDAVRAGQVSRVQFRVRGDLRQLPFSDPRQGDFRVTAHVTNATYAYVPTTPPASLPWPALTDLSGELVFDRASMSVRSASASFAGLPGLRLSKVEARIPDLDHTVVSVSADAQGPLPLPQLLQLVRSSPLARLTGNALDQAGGTGNAGLQLHLQLPISRIEQSKVQGSLAFAGNELRITPDTPLLARTQGKVQFSETGFSLAGVQARALGGDVRLEGGMRPAPNAAGESPIQLRAQGTATALGLQQARELGWVAQLARHASGSAAYSLNLNVRRGVPELLLSSNLQGLALALPAPLAKAAQTSLPLRYENRLLREAEATPAGGVAPVLRDQLTVELGSVGTATWQRELRAGRTRVLRGAIALGLAAGESLPLPADGVQALVQADRLDIDAWAAVLEPLGASAAGTPPDSQASPGSPGTGLPAADTPADYLPTRFALRTRELSAQGRTLHQALLAGTREGGVWRANASADELEGYAEYRPASAREGARDGGTGQLYARLARMRLPPSQAAQIEELFAEQPSSLPALDVVVEDFELRGRKLGRVEVEAHNRGGDGAAREWRLAKFNITAPEASLTASGNWALLGGANAGNSSVAASASRQRRTALNFRLDIRNAGELLARFGMEHVVRRGKGVMEGQVAWTGAPMNPDYRSMSGQLHLDVQSGQFLQADPGLAKLLGVLSLQALPRRLTLDFRDVFSEGFAFDFVRGDVRIERGVASTNNLQMKGVNAAVLMEGSADMNHETQDLHVVVVPELNAMTASLVATAINPVVGLGSFLAQMVLRGPLTERTTREFHIDGPWADPHVERVATTARDKPSREPAPTAPPAEATVPAQPAAADTPAAPTPASQPHSAKGEPS